MPTRTFNAPAEVLIAAGPVAYRAFSRRAVLTAAVRAACEVAGAGGVAPVAYPTLTTAVRSVTLPLSDDLHAALRIVEARCFYGRTAWLIFYGLVHHGTRVESLLQLDAEALARQDHSVLLTLSEVSTCPVPLSTRAPRVPRPPRRRKK